MGSMESIVAHDARRERIIYRATQAFLTRGYAGSLVEDIALDASVSKLTLYRLFGSKLDLAAAVLRNLADMLEAECRTALNLNAPVDEYLECVGVAYLRWFITPIGKCHVYEQVRLFTELSSIRPEYAAGYAETVTRILIPKMTAHLQARVSYGEIESTGVDFVTSHYFDILFVASNMLLTKRSMYDSFLESDLEDLVRDRVRFLLHGCAPRAEPVAANSGRRIRERTGSQADRLMAPTWEMALPEPKSAARRG